MAIIRDLSTLTFDVSRSGPAGGIQGVIDLVAKKTKYNNLITLDMGGTSTDCALIVDSKATLRRETVIDKLTVRAPSVDIRTVGAGGGSIAKFIELTSTMRVGPESSGATPGPACYGKGGVLPTVTDANLRLGYLPSILLGGDLKLDIEASSRAIKALSDQMGEGMTEEKAAEGIINLVNETMYSALRLVSVEQGHDPRDFALVAFGGAGPLHANAIGKLLGAWPVIVPPSPGILCAQGDVTTKLRHEQSASFIQTLSSIDLAELKTVTSGLEELCRAKMIEAFKGTNGVLQLFYECDMRYKGQALSLTIDYDPQLLSDKESFRSYVTSEFNSVHQKSFGYSLPDYELDIVRVGVIGADVSSDSKETVIPESEVAPITPPESAIVDRKQIVVGGEQLEAILWDRKNLPVSSRVQGPCIITEMDSNTLVLPGYAGDIDHVGNIIINPLEDSARLRPTEMRPDHTAESAAEVVEKSPLIPTLISSALASIRSEMDTLMLRCAMSPAIREQQDEFNVITNNLGQMLVGQFGSFIAAFLSMWKEVDGTIEEGDIFITNDVYQVGGAVTHLNDVIVLLPIFYKHKLVGWSANFGHLTDVGGKVPGSMSIESTTIFEDGVQIPVVKLYRKGVLNEDLVDVLCRNSRQPEWYRSDLTALVSACRVAATRICELNDRFGPLQVSPPFT